MYLESKQEFLNITYVHFILAEVFGKNFNVCKLPMQVKSTSYFVDLVLLTECPLSL